MKPTCAVRYGGDALRRQFESLSIMHRLEEDIPKTLEVPLGSLVEMAIECWRLERWLNGAGRESPSSHVRHVARRLAKFLEERGLEIMDLTGRRYEPGLAVEVLDTIGDDELAEGVEVVDEMISPVVLWRGTVVHHGQVIIRRKL